MAGKHRRIVDPEAEEESSANDGLEAAPEAPMATLSPAAVLPVTLRTGRQALRDQRRSRSRRIQLLGVGVLAVVVAVTAGYFLLPSGGKDKHPTAPVSGVRPQTTLLLQLVDATNQTVGGVLFAQNRAAGGSAFGALVPATLLVQLPGVGGVPFSATSSSGGAGAQPAASALSDALNVRIDGGWRLSTDALGRLVDSVGGVDVTVDQDIQQTTTSGTVLLLHAGPQHLSGSQAVAFATYLDTGSPEQERLARLSSVLGALIAKLPAGKPALTTSLTELGESSSATVAVGVVADFLASMRADAVAGHLSFDNVPTHPLDPGGTLSTVVVDGTALASFVKTNFAQSLPTTPAGGPISVLVQNGVGTPGLDDKARTKLVAAGLLFSSGGNASTFDNPTSTILITDGSQKARAQGATVAAALGLPASDVKIADVGQNIADVVVVLGADFKA